MLTAYLVLEVQTSDRKSKKKERKVKHDKIMTSEKPSSYQERVITISYDHTKVRFSIDLLFVWGKLLLKIPPQCPSLKTGQVLAR